MKRKVPANYNALDDLSKRLGQFIATNHKALRNNLTDLERVRIEGQNMSFQATLALISQIHKGGSIWRGGYKDNVGVVYTDQLQEILNG